MRYDVKRWHTVVSFMLFVVLCMTITYWVMQMFQPAQRPLAEPAMTSADNINLEAAASLFGGNGIKPRAAANYQLKGIVLASDPGQSVAILVESGKPPRSVRTGGEIAPNVRVKEVQQQYVLLSEGGAVTRIDLPQEKVPMIGSTLSSPAGRDAIVIAESARDVPVPGISPSAVSPLGVTALGASTPVASSSEKD